MTKVYRAMNNEYVTLVSHYHDLSDGEYGYYGVFEYSISRDVDSGEWDLHIFDVGDSEIVDTEDIRGLNLVAVSNLVKASRGEIEYEDIVKSDYYERLERFEAVLRDDVLLMGLAAEYAEREEA